MSEENVTFVLPTDTHARTHIYIYFCYTPDYILNGGWFSYIYLIKIISIAWDSNFERERLAVDSCPRSGVFFRSACLKSS